ncbi:hypothetical protein P9112_007946 [Eukaryota sp. TZLM1-RC]
MDETVTLSLYTVTCHQCTRFVSISFYIRLLSMFAPPAECSFEENDRCLVVRFIRDRTDCCCARPSCKKHKGKIFLWAAGLTFIVLMVISLFISFTLQSLIVGMLVWLHIWFMILFGCLVHSCFDKCLGHIGSRVYESILTLDWLENEVRVSVKNQVERFSYEKVYDEEHLSDVVIKEESSNLFSSNSYYYAIQLKSGITVDIPISNLANEDAHIIWTVIQKALKRFSQPQTEIEINEVQVNME